MKEDSSDHQKAPTENSEEQDPDSSKIAPIPPPSCEIIRSADIGFYLTDDPEDIFPWTSAEQKLAFEKAEAEAFARDEDFSPEKFLEDWNANSVPLKDPKRRLKQNPQPQWKNPLNRNLLKKKS